MDLFSKQYHAPGTMPGTLLETDNGIYSLSMVQFDKTFFSEDQLLSPRQCIDRLSEVHTSWIHIQGTPTLEVLRELEETFGLHSLHLEDILNTGQRPKLDIIDDKAFVILNLPTIVNNKTHVNQVCLSLIGRTIISLCIGDDNPFHLIYERLRQGAGKIRSRSPDFFFYTLMDTVIDHGFPVLEEYAERIEEIEEKLITQPSEDTLQQVHKARRELLLLHRRLWPHREVINSLLRDDVSQIISEDTRIYLRDCYDHTISVLELLETYREMTAAMLEVYLSSVSRRLNEVMRVLTVITTIFIPPTFIVGVYGMNFDRSAGWLNMPELSLPFGYLGVWLVIAAMFTGMILYFRRKKWF